VFTQPNYNLARRARRLALPAWLVVVFTSILVGCGAVGLAYSQHIASHTRYPAKSAAQPVILAVEPTRPGKSFAPGAVGLSLETEELATADLSGGHRSLVALMRKLGPGVLRFGGNSLDRSWWTSDSEASPAWATSAITPADLTILHKLLVATGWHVILGVNLGHFDPVRAANEARVAKRILGSRLLGLEIGNEPNDYGDPRVKLRPSSYDVSEYLEELGIYKAAIQGAVPGMRLYGPDLYSQAWLSATAADKNKPFAAITMHYYPISYSVPRGPCEGTPVPTALELLSPQVRERENIVVQALVRAGEIAHSETRITETNNTGSCDVAGGPATSPVFASALWSFDWVLRAASAGVSGLNFHGYLGRCFPNTFSPICAPSDTAEARGQVTAQPEYYGLLAARQLEGGRFVPIRVVAQGIGSDLTAYATTHRGGVLTIAIDNFEAEATRPASILLRVTGYRKVTEEHLSGPSTSAMDHVTFGRASIDASGARRSTDAKSGEAGGGFRITLGPSSATVITLHKRSDAEATK
jgi:hypothetical protein